jgi:hypothetical protein
MTEIILRRNKQSMKDNESFHKPYTGSNGNL